ncbi:hypothetical protein BGZ65_008467 [Modicella reniformis]|uniref:Uncharacterized protein n=1 Tax=Modicella reniformis TaxID=1440133 RepID=A0A9P6MF14_9FUNG|nr:hypothetical protein BGZ65_008467 [Modicella reniformis]
MCKEGTAVQSALGYDAFSTPLAVLSALVQSDKPYLLERVSAIAINREDEGIAEKTIPQDIHMNVFIDMNMKI